MKQRQIIVIALLLGAAGCGKKEAAPPPDAPVPAPPSIAADGKGALGKVLLTKEEATTLRVATARVERKRLEYTLEVPGLVFAAPENMYIVSSPVSGRVAEVYAHEGESVRKGQMLAELESLEFSTLVADYLQSRAEEQFQTKQLARITDLVRKRVNPQNELEKAQADYDRARASLRAAMARLLAVGINQSELNSWDTVKVVDPHLKIVSPINGAIAEHRIDRGQAVNALQTMLSIVNLDRVLVHGYVSPEDAGMISVNDSVRIMVRSESERSIMARITSINPTLDERNRSITIYILTQTRDRWPKPGDNVRLAIHVRTAEPVITIPPSSVVYEGTAAVVFVRTGENSFEKRSVNIARRTAEGMIVSGGITAGEEVAVSQVFSLKALSRIEQFAD